MAYPMKTQNIQFQSAVPVWAAGREKELNLWLSARAKLPRVESCILKLTGSSAYIVKVDGAFIAFGPARSAHGFYRVDELELAPYIKEGGSILTITVAGYNCNSYYHIEQPSFLCAELTADGDIIAATGKSGFFCREVTEHEQKAERYSFQRTFCEVYNLDPRLAAWETEQECAGFSLLEMSPTEEKTFIARGCGYNTYDWTPAKSISSRVEFHVGDHSDELKYQRQMKEISDIYKGFYTCDVTTDSLLAARNLDLDVIHKTDEAPGPEQIRAGHAVTYQMERNTTGQIAFDAVCEEDAEIIVTFDEYLDKDDYVNFRRMSTVNAPIFRLKKGSYHLSTFEPYTMSVLRIFVTRGSVRVSGVGLVYFGANKTQKRYSGNDPVLAKIFDAAVETYRQNTFTIFMDCPSRERAGWLCDSFFTARVEKILTGNSEIEHNFLENFFLPDSFRCLPKGMFPMCYPGDQVDGNFIPNWAMWLVIELEEHLERTGDRSFVDAAKPRIDALLEYFKPFENQDGLLEKLKKWVFVEWSKSNELVQDINYPTNMLYAKMLRCAANLYGDNSLREKADRIARAINEQSYLENGFYCDNAVYNETGKAVLSGKCTESCQYYAFFCEIATPESRPELWRRLLHDFGPYRVKKGAWPNFNEDAKWQDIYPSNAFIGNYLRLELLYRYGEYEKLTENIKGYFLKMAELTGTLWENDMPTASCNHGFASHVIYWMNGMGMVE
ncbi:MAG: hypothetical protein DBY04_04435 [Clostridiales bacterium]|nr:MAG: hypothetical protein DBY04_04435 [Clostridiales bacterium]